MVAGNCGFTIAPCRPEHRELIGKTLQHVEDMNLEPLKAGIPWDFETFPEYLDSVARHGSVLNYAAYVGHTAVRLFVMGDAGYERAATEDELAAMARWCARRSRRARRASRPTSAPTHQRRGWAPGPVQTRRHPRDGGARHPAARPRSRRRRLTPGERVKHPEIYELQKRIGRPFTWTALLTRRGATFAQDMAAYTKEQQAEGAEVYPQVTCGR